MASLVASAVSPVICQVQPTLRRPNELPPAAGLGAPSLGNGTRRVALRSAKQALPLRSQQPQRLKVEAARGGPSGTVEVEVDKPIGIELGQKGKGVIEVTNVQMGGNGAKAGIKVGDQVVYTSSWFGDELWPSDNLSFTMTTIRAKPDSVYFVLSRGATVDVKRLPKRPAPPRFGRKLTDAQKARATHICLDCGYIYTLSKPFEEQPEDYNCPQCSAPKKRFAGYDPETGKVTGATTPIVVIVSFVLGAIGLGAAVYFGLQ
eukprot:TRINITY_DN36176_c0_g1_i1.p1 TRINITY_DN36176_c0_g1~~TRINITY_DN36176_c0_g1_i1.p1  ORF type:complete len:261 (+),score=38.34 TRINITY_DN36176_c0_g1_i1:170-952(+)